MLARFRDRNNSMIGPVQKSTASFSDRNFRRVLFDTQIPRSGWQESIRPDLSIIPLREACSAVSNQGPEIFFNTRLAMAAAGTILRW